MSADPHRASVDRGHGLLGRTTDHTSGSTSCDSGFIHRQQVYTVVDTFNPRSSALAEVGGSAAPTDAGGRPLLQRQVGRPPLQRQVVRELRGWMTQFEVTHMTYGRSEIHLIGILHRGSVWALWVRD
ncbi:uncharacterized protein DS421_11g330650 [Arachis hypogaea]|nr:uncharacterized protein DS421_11g330650 [Arachis hypogaea]